jgi:hypothetical protein
MHRNLSMPELIDAGTYTVYYRITATNYKPYTGSAIVTIKQKEIQVVTADQETTYLEEAPKFTVDSVNGMVLLKIRMLFYHS